MCSYGTSSGMPAQKGVVAMQYYWYLLFGFEHLYIPGYGNAVVGDVGGANLIQPLLDRPGLRRQQLRAMVRLG